MESRRAKGEWEWQAGCTKDNRLKKKEAFSGQMARVPPSPMAEEGEAQRPSFQRA